MAKKFIFLLAIVLMFLYSCTSSTEIKFEQGVKKLDDIDKKYNTNLKSAPNSTAYIDELLTEITGFAAINQMEEPLRNLIDFRIKFLEAEKLHAEGWQWGRASTTEYGFGCKGYDRIKQSARLRNMSAQAGYEAVSILQKFADKYPEESKSIDITQKDALFLNAAYVQIEEKARKDDRIIEGLCGKKAKNQTTEAESAA